MPDIFVTADLHLGHRALGNGDFGVRPWKSVEAHDEAIIARWNDLINPDDTVYLLGDVAFNNAGLRSLESLSGKKRLVMGNHDKQRVQKYAKVFERVYGSKSIDGMLMTHIPVHPSCLNRGSMQVNIHGHLHEERVHKLKSHMDGVLRQEPGYDQRYACVSLENTGYQPIELSMMRDMFNGWGMLRAPV